jgi:hypothetical protein
MINKELGLDIYLIGIGGTGMGALAGLLKSQGHSVRGSDSTVYSPMKEKLKDWGISYKTPYSKENLQKRPDLVIVGNVIRKENPEAELVRLENIAQESFPSALKKLSKPGNFSGCDWNSRKDHVLSPDGPCFAPCRPKPRLLDRRHSAKFWREFSRIEPFALSLCGGRR